MVAESLQNENIPCVTMAHIELRVSLLKSGLHEGQHAASLRIRLSEPESRILALRIAATFPGYEASTSQLKEFMPGYVHFNTVDLEPNSTRANECKWQQVVGNVISHQQSGSSIYT